MTRFMRSYRGARRSNMPSTASCLASPSGQRAVVAEDRRAHCARSQPGSFARGRELGRVADRFEVLLRDLEQHAAEVVARRAW